MFTKPELKLFKDGYFNIIRIEDRIIMAQSKNTGHCWMIFRKELETEKPYVLYHKHSLKDPWYHEHRRARCVSHLVKEIKSHDGYVVEHPDYLKQLKYARRTS